MPESVTANEISGQLREISRVADLLAQVFDTLGPDTLVLRGNETVAFLIPDPWMIFTYCMEPAPGAILPIEVLKAMSLLQDRIVDVSKVVRRLKIDTITLPPHA